MSPEEWETIALLLHRGFKWSEPFGESHEFAYRTLLDGYEADQIAGVIRALVARGQVFGPTPGEIVSMIRTDPSVPTGTELIRLLYGPGGVFKARPARRGFIEADELARATDRVQLRRAQELHPVLGEFVERRDIGRLRRLNVDHEEFGELERKRLIGEWEAFLEAREGRELASIASGGRRGMRQLDPMSGLSGPRPELKAIEGGER